MTDLAVAVLAAIGAYTGSVYALSKRPTGPIAADATAQAYRDAIVALLELRRAYFQMHLKLKSNRDVSEDMKADVFRAEEDVDRIRKSASFLFTQADVDALDKALAGFSEDDSGQWVDSADEAIDELRRSAYRLFPSR